MHSNVNIGSGSEGRMSFPITEVEEVQIVCPWARYFTHLTYYECSA